MAAAFAKAVAVVSVVISSALSIAVVVTLAQTVAVASAEVPSARAVAVVAAVSVAP